MDYQVGPEPKWVVEIELSLDMHLFCCNKTLGGVYEGRSQEPRNIPVRYGDFFYHAVFFDVQLVPTVHTYHSPSMNVHVQFTLYITVNSRLHDFVQSLQ